jgi:hypothetical protein
VEGLCLRNDVAIGFRHSFLLQHILSPRWNHHFDTKRVEPASPRGDTTASSIAHGFCVDHTPAPDSVLVSQAKSRIASRMKATCTLFGMESLLQERFGEEERHPVPEFQMGLKDLNTGGAASSQQVALGGFTAAKAARRPAECGYTELPENGCGDLRNCRLHYQTQPY